MSDKVSELVRCEDCLWHGCSTGCQCKCHLPALPSEPAAPKKHWSDGLTPDELAIDRKKPSSKGPSPRCPKCGLPQRTDFDPPVVQCVCQKLAEEPSASQWQVEECSSMTVNTPNPLEAIDELGNPDKCPTCNGYHMGGCHKAKSKREEPAAKCERYGPCEIRPNCTEPLCRYPDCGQPKSAYIHHIVQCLPNDHAFMGEIEPVCQLVEERSRQGQLINANLLTACKMALGAFENNHAIDWNILQRAIEDAEAARDSAKHSPQDPLGVCEVRHDPHSREISCINWVRYDSRAKTASPRPSK